MALKALVTGGSGFIGSEVIRQLLAKGIAVRALLRKTSSRRNLEGLEYETATGDLNDLEALKKAVAGVDYVFHIAGALVGKNREELFLHNSEGTSKLAQACAEANPKLKRFVYVSSLAASGPASSLDPKTESDPEAPVSDYGASKLGGEKELEKWSKDFATTVIRPPAVYGPRDTGILEFVKFVNNGVTPVFSAKSHDGHKYLSIIHVEDLVQGIVLAGLADGQSKKEVFFLSGDNIFSWADLFGVMAEALGKKTVRVPIPIPALTGLAAFYGVMTRIFNKSFPLTLDKIKELRQDYWICSNERAKKVLGFKPRWEIKPGITQTVGWYKENGWI
jgi:nucleoside-diphosphate-sugar epimerase